MRPEHKKFILENTGRRSLAEIAAALGLKERKIRKFLEKEERERPEPSLARAQLPAIEKKRLWACLAAIALLGFLVYANALGGRFIWDDGQLVEGNVYIRSLSGIADIFTKNVALAAGEKFSFYRPLQMVTYAVDHSLWKLNPLGYHLTNVLLHISVALLLFWSIQLLFGNQALSLATALFFVVHPVHTEAVTYIAGRADPLASVFLLAGLIFYLKAERIRRSWYYPAVLVFFACALLSREQSLVFPFLLLFVARTFDRKLEPKLFAGLGTLTAAYIVLRLTLLRYLLPDAASYPTTVFQRVPGALAALAQYARLLFFPVDLHMEYGNVVFPWGQPQVLAGMVVLGILIALLVRARRADAVVFFGAGWFLLWLLPVLNIYPLDAYMAEHWLYLPSMGFCLGLAQALRRLARISRLKVLAGAVGLGLLVFYSALTVRQNGTWREPVAFYQRTLALADPTPRLLNNLGNAYRALGRKEDALALYQKAMDLDPSYVKSLINMAATLDSLGRGPEAIDAYEKALAREPGFAVAYNNLGTLYLRSGEREKAAALYEKAIQADPGYAEAYYNLGYADDLMGRKEEAAGLYQKALALKPDYPRAYNNLGYMRYRDGDLEAAASFYQKALTLNPDYAEAMNNLAVVSFYQKEYRKAIELHDRAAALGLPNEALQEALEPFRAEAYN